MAVLSFVALAGITASLHRVLQKNSRGDILKLIAQNSALVKAHNKKLGIYMIFFRLYFFFWPLKIIICLFSEQSNTRIPL